MGKVLAGAEGFCGACGTAAAAAREATGTGPCGSGEVSLARAEVDDGVGAPEAAFRGACGSSLSACALEAPPPGSSGRRPRWPLQAGVSASSHPP